MKKWLVGERGGGKGGKGTLDDDDDDDRNLDEKKLFFLFFLFFRCLARYDGGEEGKKEGKNGEERVRISLLSPFCL